MSRSLRTSPVSLAAARWGARNSTHSRSSTAASLVSSRLIASSSKYVSEAMTRRAWVTNTAARLSLSSSALARSIALDIWR